MHRAKFSLVAVDLHGLHAPEIALPYLRYKYPYYLTSSDGDTEYLISPQAPPVIGPPFEGAKVTVQNLGYSGTCSPIFIAAFCS